MPTIPALFNNHKILNFVAQNKYLFYLLGGISAGTITILLITQSLPVNYSQHLAYKNALHKREEILFKLKQTAWELKPNNLNSNPEILSLLNQLEQNQEKIEKIPDFIADINFQEYSHGLSINSQQIHSLNKIFKNINNQSINPYNGKTMSHSGYWWHIP